MVNFNKVKEKKEVTNLAGGKAYALNPKMELLSILLTSFLKDSFYQKGDKTLENLVKVINKIEDKKFVAKAALYARDKFNMRSVSHVVAGELATIVKGETWTKNFFEKIVVRVDDMSEIMSYYFSAIKANKKGKYRPVPNAMKKGFRSAFDKFDKYQLAKYRGENKSLKLIDLVNLVRPKATEKNTEALTLLVKNELKSFDTWEVKLSEAGKLGETEEAKETLKANAWKELLETNKIGYFALLRNLRNIILQAPEMIDKACELLTNENMVKKSRVLPFRFTTALEEIEKIGGDKRVIIALNKAVDLALKNVPVFEGTTLIAIDVSGSMGGKPAEIASLFGAVLAKANDKADLLLFDTDTKFKVVNPMDSTLTIAKSLRFNGGGTDFHCIFISLKKAYDRIIILSDMQGWVGYQTPTRTFKEYKSKFNCNPFIYSFDLQSYGTTQFPEDKVFCLYGFSDKIFEIMSMFEQDKTALIQDIENSVYL